MNEKIISFEVLRRAVDLLLNAAAAQGDGRNVALSAQYYWDVPLAQKYRMGIPVEVLAKATTVGDLFDDYLVREKALEKPASATLLDLQSAASLLSYIVASAINGVPKDNL